MSEVELKISQETYENLDALRRPGENFEEMLKRLAHALRTSGLMSPEPPHGKGDDNG